MGRLGRLSNSAWRTVSSQGASAKSRQAATTNTFGSPPRARLSRRHPPWLSTRDPPTLVTQRATPGLTLGLRDSKRYESSLNAWASSLNDHLFSISHSRRKPCVH